MGKIQAYKRKYGKKTRPIVIKEIEKFRECGDVKKGFTLFVCEGCNDVRKVPYRCKGRFCTTCSVGESEEWSRLLSHEIVQVSHRHLLKDMMDEAARLIKDYFQKKARVVPGIIVGLHTFGSKVNFNPHVHMISYDGRINRKEGVETI